MVVTPQPGTKEVEKMRYIPLRVLICIHLFVWHLTV